MSLKDKKREEEKKEIEEIEEEYGFDKSSCDFWGRKYLTKHGRMIANNKFLFAITGFQCFIILVLLFGYFRLTSQRSFAVYMPDYGTIQVSRMKANEEYYRVWGDYVISRVANFTPTSVRHSVNKASVIFDKASWEHQKAHIDKYIKVIEDNSISQEFKFNDSDVKLKQSKDGSKATIEYKGIATQNINDLSKQTIECVYRFGFFVEDGRPFQESIYTNCLSGGNKGKNQKKDTQK